MPNNITGVGVIGARDPVDGSMYLSPAFTCTLTEERTVDVSKGHSETDCTPLRDLDVADKDSEFTCNMGTQILDEEAINWILFNNRRQTSASIELPTLVSGTIAGGALTVTGLLVDQANVSVVILDALAPGNISLAFQASGGTIDATNFEVTADTITVDASYNGKVAVVYYRTTESTVEITGGNTNYTPYANVELFMKVCGTRFADKRLWIPRATSLNGVNFDPGADEFTREFRCLLPAGFSVPYVFFDAA
ncbi:hypothetical protein Xen7305DRAFT_00008690 [Xenococcus sp. PCC 7305]|uniref:hypothetical protein n=1 Tax=Xenococcus sp. PCC 7305 TaxID=102125 RepID=UPI0002ABC8BC|nr:hypothetical protein [Xenococcus sp. PCC 7305]ELS01167.1 hypothetical protein Xen7305DRAFT_00008690 [Xenococcus sp. PCC 7305]